MTESLRDELIAAGTDAGLERMAVAGAGRFDDVRRNMEERLATGMSGQVRFTFKDPRRATDPALSFEWAKRLVVGLRSYLPEAGTAPVRPGHGRIARFAVDDPYLPLRRGLEAVASLLDRKGHRAEVLVDDDRLVDRAAAVRAGLGWWGKSTLVITPGLGPWFVIGSVVTDATLPLDQPMTRNCGTCDACLPACPTGALVAPGVLDARRCLSALAQSSGVIPREWRSALEDRLYGCDECLDACPPGLRLARTGTAERGSVDLRWLLRASDDALLDHFSHFYIPRRSPRYLRRNALVVIGNDGGRDFLPLVIEHAAHPDWLLRLHAIWALGRIGGPAVEPVLRERAVVESDERVRTEISIELDLLTAGTLSQDLSALDSRPESR